MPHTIHFFFAIASAGESVVMAISLPRRRGPRWMV
jgi:hypothetical protein